MRTTSTQHLFTVSNHHVADCGQSPMVDGDTPNSYHGYFENVYGEQFIFVYNRDTGQGFLWCGDAGWEQPYPVIDGHAPGLILSPEEQRWLQVCWQTALHQD